MDAILNALDLRGELSGAGNGRWLECSGTTLQAVSPVDGRVLTTIRQATPEDYDRVVAAAGDAFRHWREWPAPKRGEVVRQIGNALRDRKAELGALVSLETGKIRAEGEGEVQEMIDMADFSVGQSRMLYGLSMHSERAGHRMYEQWHPLGVVGVITAFNFPVAPWSWNALIALTAGDAVVWKPSSKAPLCAIAVMKIVWDVLEQNGAPTAIAGLVIGQGRDVGEAMLEDRRLPLISATGSVRMGRRVAEVVGRRLGRTILELGGNNAIIVTEAANLDLAVRAITFGAVGTAGQRCTTTRRIIAHEDIYDELLSRLVAAYRQVKIGNPLDADTLMGPLIDPDAVQAMQTALGRISDEGGRVVYGGEVLTGGVYDAGTYVTPCICEMPADAALICEETFAPILYLIRYRDLDDAIAIHNNVPQGLSSAIFTNALGASERFLGPAGSDCGIANVNIGTSGAEIGGAFGGEKDTGGGRESGSDAWKAYMRRQTCTINWSGELPLAQGIEFDV